MDYKEMAEAAFRSYDELRTERDALTAKEQTEEVRAQVTELESRMDEKVAEAKELEARASRDSEAAELRSKISGLYVPRSSTSSTDGEELRNLLNRGGSGNFEIRAVDGDATKSFTNASFGNAVLNAYIEDNPLVKAGAVPQVDNYGGPIAATVVSPIDVDRTARGSAFPDTTADSEVTLSSYVYGGIVRVDRAHIQDSAANLVTSIGNRLGRYVSAEVATDLVLGDGTNKPSGLKNHASTGSNAAANALTWSDLLDLRFSVSDPDNSSWVMHGTTAAAIFDLDEASWVIDPRTGITTLMGRPVIVDSRVETVGASARSVYFGNFRDGYFMRMVGNVEVQVLNELYANYNQVGLLGRVRADGRITDPEAIKCVLHAAS